MANPQREDGYTEIANEIIEALAKTNLSPRESRIVWALFRKTYGWHKTVDRISCRQFAKLTGLPRQKCYETLARLEKRKVVTRVGDSWPISWRFQKDYEKWRVSPPGGTKSPPSLNKSPPPVAFKSPPGGGDKRKKRNHTKERKNPDENALLKKREKNRAWLRQIITELDQKAQNERATPETGEN